MWLVTGPVTGCTTGCTTAAAPLPPLLLPAAAELPAGLVRGMGAMPLTRLSMVHDEAGK